MVVDERGVPLGFGRSVGRVLAETVSAATLGIGDLCVVVDPHKRRVSLIGVARGWCDVIRLQSAPDAASAAGEDQNDGAEHEGGAQEPPAHHPCAEVAFMIHKPVAGEPDEQDAHQSPGRIEDVGGSSLAVEGEGAHEEDALRRQKNATSEKPGPSSAREFVQGSGEPLDEAEGEEGIDPEDGGQESAGSPFRSPALHQQIKDRETDGAHGSADDRHGEAPRTFVDVLAIQENNPDRAQQRAHPEARAHRLAGEERGQKGDDDHLETENGHGDRYISPFQSEKLGELAEKEAGRDKTWLPEPCRVRGGTALEPEHGKEQGTDEIGHKGGAPKTGSEIA